MAKNKTDKEKRLDKVYKYIDKLKKQGYDLSDVINKTAVEISRNLKSFDNFIKLAKRKLEREQIKKEVKAYEEKLNKKFEKENEEYYQKYPWLKGAMKFDNNYKNIKSAKEVYNKIMTKEKNSLLKMVSANLDVKGTREFKEFTKLVNKVDDVNLLKTYLNKVEYIILAYLDSHVEDNSTMYSDEEVLDQVNDNFDRFIKEYYFINRKSSTGKERKR